MQWLGFRGFGMSLEYKLFGKPKTFEEFLDEQTRLSQRKIDVLVGQTTEARGFLSSTSYQKAYIDVRGRKRSLRLIEASYVLNDNFSSLINKDQVDRILLAGAVHIAKELESRGFETQIIFYYNLLDMDTALEFARDGVPYAF